MQLPASSSSKKLVAMTLHMDRQQYMVLLPVMECKDQSGVWTMLGKAQPPFPAC